MHKKRFLSLEDTSNNITLSDIFDSFILFKESQNISERTIKEYKAMISKFLMFSKNSLDEKCLLNATLMYFKELSNKSADTYNNHFKNLHCFLNWCIKHSFIEYNPIIKLGYKKKKANFRAKDIKLDILRDLLNKMDLKTYKGLRDYTIVLISLDTGVRPNELLNTLKSDFNFKSNELIIRQEVSKTNQQRLLPLSNIVSDTIQKLISVTPKEWRGNYVFYTVDGLPLTSNRWSKIICNYSKQIGYHISAYNLRHYFALNFLRNGGNIFSLQIIMGHTSLDMTKRYLALTQVDVQEQHKLATPINKLVQRNTRVIKLFK